MKLIMGADVHASNSLPFAKLTDEHPVYTDRLLDVAFILKQGFSHALEQGASALVVLGDLFDVQRVDAPTLKMVADTVASAHRAGLSLWVLPGNHDLWDGAGKLYTPEALAHVPGFRFLHEQTLTLDGINVHVIPYLPLGITRAKLDAMDWEDEDDVFWMHHTFQGCVDGFWNAPDGVDPGFAPDNYTFSGHFHTPQVFPGMGGRYLGAPMQHHFGDAGESHRGWYVWDSDTPKHVKPLPTFSPTFETVLTGEDRDGLLILPAPTDGTAYVTIKATGTAEDVKRWHAQVEEEMLEWDVRFVRRDFTIKSPRKYRAEVKVGMKLGDMIEPYVTTMETGMDVERLIKYGREALGRAVR